MDAPIKSIASAASKASPAPKDSQPSVTILFASPCALWQLVCFVKPAALQGLIVGSVTSGASCCSKYLGLVLWVERSRRW